MSNLPNCDCAQCHAAVAKLAAPVRVMSQAEATAWNRAYADRRRRLREGAPFITRDEIAAAESGR